MSHTVDTTTTDYFWDIARPLAVVLQDGTHTYVYGLDLIAAVDGSGDPTYFTYDGLGSTTDLTDESADTVATRSYDVFGAIRSETGNNGNYWNFTGEQLDTDSDLYFLRARYYDPATGRFLGRDPAPSVAGRPGANGAYSYVGSNPATWVDPSGMWCPKDPEDCDPTDEIEDAADEVGDAIDDVVVDPIQDAVNWVENLDTTTMMQILDILPIAEMCGAGVFLAVWIGGGANPASAAAGGAAGLTAYVECDKYIEDPIGAIAAAATQRQIMQSGCGPDRTGPASSLNLLNWQADLGLPVTEPLEAAIYLTGNDLLDCDPPASQYE